MNGKKDLLLDNLLFELMNNLMMKMIDDNHHLFLMRYILVMDKKL
jgi:hypothetical protein